MARPKKEEVIQESGDRFTDILNKINKKETIFMVLSEETYTNSVPCLSTGILSLDRILGQGLPKGRIVEVFGPYSSGKSTLCAQILASAQMQGGIGSYVDVECSVDPSYFNKLGVDWSNVLFTQPSSGEEALNIVMNLIPLFKSGDVIIVDSVAALTPQAELDGEIGQQFMGLQARMMGQALRKLTGMVAEHGVILIFINQIREALGVTYGSNERTSGGRALAFYSSIRIDIRKIGQIKKGEDIIGNKTKIKIVKNKVFPPFRECEVEMIFGEGISPIRDLINCAIDGAIIDKAGTWLSFEGQQLGQGLENSAQFLKDNPEIANKIEKLVREALKL